MLSINLLKHIYLYNFQGSPFLKQIVLGKLIKCVIWYNLRIFGSVYKRVCKQYRTYTKMGKSCQNVYKFH